MTKAEILEEIKRAQGELYRREYLEAAVTLEQLRIKLGAQK